MAAPIHRFVRDLLSHAGAIVEDAGDDVLDVVAEPALRARLDLAEFQPLAFSPDAAGPGVVMVDYDSPLLEKLGGLVDGLGRVAFAQGPRVALKKVDPEHELSRALRLQNGVFRFQSMAAVEVVDLCVVFEFSVLADERAGGVVPVWVNPATRSRPRFDAWLEAADLAEGRPDEAAAADLTLPWGLATAAARAAVAPALREFQESLTRRRDRDLKRLREYYLEIDQEIRRKLTRARVSDDVRRREIERLAATSVAYRTRIADIADRYRVRVRLAPIAVFACRVPTYQFTVRLMRRNASAEALFSWNPVDGRVETRACDGCDTPTEAAFLCDDCVHYLCEHCLNPCRACGRAYCRACHKDCPREHGPQAPGQSSA